MYCPTEIKFFLRFISTLPVLELYAMLVNKKDNTIRNTTHWKNIFRFMISYHLDVLLQKIRDDLF